jgi:parallel beta-helix repeat protein
MLRIRTILILLLTVSALHSYQLLASTFVVGPTTCRPTLPHFATIQTAVNVSTSGSTVLVCPGNYPEQVVISSPLILKGIANGGSSAVVITVPPGGLIENGMSSLFGAMNVQLLIQNTKGVSVSGLTVDGSGTGSFCSDTMAGIELFNVGQSGKPGKVSNVVVRNGCGIGILSDTSHAELELNSIHGTGGENIYTYAGTNKILSNTLTGTMVVEGIDSSQASGSVVSGNKVPGGMMLQDIGGVTVSQNTVQNEIFLNESSNDVVANNVAILAPDGRGIKLFSTCIPSICDSGGTLNNTITGNNISGGLSGISWFVASGNLVQNNLVTNVKVGISIEDAHGSGNNTVTNNTVNEADCGISIAELHQTVFSPNGLFNVKKTICNFAP